MSKNGRRQQASCELAVTLAAQRVVPLGLSRRARYVRGRTGIVDGTMLMGWFFRRQPSADRTAVLLMTSRYHYPTKLRSSTLSQRWGGDHNTDEPNLKLENL